MLTHADEARFFRELIEKLPYGVALWTSSIGLAHELGAGTGLPRIVASAFGARVTQTDYQEVALSVCRRNGERNGAGAIEYRVADWTASDDAGRYDYLIGSDVLSGEKLHRTIGEEVDARPVGVFELARPAWMAD